MGKIKDVLIRMVLAVAGPVLSVFAMRYHGVFAWFCYVLFFYAVRGMGPKQAYRYGAIGGAAIGILFFTGLYRYGIGIIVAIAIYVMLQGALFGLAVGLTNQRSWKGPWVLFPAMVWAILDFIRTLSPISLPFNFSTSQYENIALIQVASITGTYGITFIIVLVNCILYKVLMKTASNKVLHSKKLITIAAGTLSVLFLSFVLPKMPIMAVPVSGEKPIEVAIIQGSVLLDQYRVVNTRPGVKKEIREKYFSLTETIKKGSVDIIVWPEGVLGEYAMQEPSLRDRLRIIPRAKDAVFVAGMPSKSREGIFNSIYAFLPSGNIAGQYDKMRLVPYFEEYKPGKRSPVIDTRLAKLGMAICFESVYPKMIRRLVKEKADLICVLTNDVGFSKDILVDLHARESVFRAVENRRYVVRAAQSGISMFIDPFGNVLSRSKELEQIILRGTVYPQTKTTFYSKFGDCFIYMCILACVFMILFKKRL